MDCARKSGQGLLESQASLVQGRHVILRLCVHSRFSPLLAVWKSLQVLRRLGKGAGELGERMNRLTTTVPPGSSADIHTSQQAAILCGPTFVNGGESVRHRSKASGQRG